MDVNKLMAELERKHPGESEYLQAVREVLMTVEEAYNQHPEFEANRIAERIVEPDRIFTFKVVWVDDKGDVQVNLGYRIQFNNAIGPYKTKCSDSSASTACPTDTFGRKVVDPEIPRFRADFQECADDAAHGRCQRRLGFQPQGQIRP